jgi:hypothetical protein
MLSVRCAVSRHSPVNVYVELPDLQAGSTFQRYSIGLGFRAIPALRAGARQFQPSRVSVSIPDCWLHSFCKFENNLVRTLGKICVRLA